MAGKPKEKWARGLNGHYVEKDTQIANMPIKSSLTKRWYQEVCLKFKKIDSSNCEDGSENWKEIKCPCKRV